MPANIAKIVPGATTSPPLAHGNFAVIPTVYRGPYEYSTPEYTEADFLPQHHVLGAPAPAAPGGGMLADDAAAQQEH